jgi:hypothetical protein
MECLNIWFDITDDRRHVVILLYTKNYNIKDVYFPKVCFIIHDCMALFVRGASVSTTSQVHTSAMFVLPIVGN